MKGFEYNLMIKKENYDLPACIDILKTGGRETNL